MGEQLLYLLLAFFLVLLNGFFVAAEFAIVKVRPTRVEELAREGNRRARIARHLIEHLDAYLSATQVGITIASIGLGWVGERAFGHLVEPLLAAIGLPPAAFGWVVAFTIVTFLHVVVGELAPKSLAIQRAEKTALWTSAPLRLFSVIMWPAIASLNWASLRLLRLIGLKPASGLELAHSAEELRMIVEASERSGELNPQEKQLLENALQFSERLVREIMVPRPDMVCLYTTKSLEENLAIARESAHTRYPLAVEDKDHIVGMIHVRDLIAATERARGDGGSPPSLEKLRRPILFVPEVATIDRVLRTFQRSRSHLAVVVDEYGGVAGLVTLEDVLEELVGEIRDEFDIEETDLIATTASGEVIVDAGTPLHEIAESLQFEPAQATVDTIGGYVLQLLGRLPKVGEQVQMGRYKVEVAEMDGLRVTKLRFKPFEPKSAAAQAPPRAR